MNTILIVALAVTVVWILGLVVLAVLTANPVTINERQIRQSDLIVTASRNTDKSSTLIVTKEWFRGEDLGTITVTNLADTNMPIGQEFLVPLQRLPKERFQVTSALALMNAPLIYPATPEAERQLQSLLESGE